MPRRKAVSCRATGPAAIGIAFGTRVSARRVEWIVDE
jgi:hypothetical protein